MLYGVERQFPNQEIRLPVETMQPCRIVVKVRHPRKPNTYYFDTAPVINGRDMFVIKVPKMPESVVVEVYNEANGNIQFDNTFRVGKIKVGPIRSSFMISKIMEPNVAKFMIFSDDFAENASILSAQNSIYRSPDGKFRIDYKDVIRDENGKEMRTPARVHSKTKIMEVAKKYYLGYTVAGRKALLYHEFAHVWMNKNPHDELEADKNAIMLYLGTGNPIIEVYNVWLRVFRNTPTDQNRERYDALNKYVKNFGKEMNRLSNKQSA